MSVASAIAAMEFERRVNVVILWQTGFPVVAIC